MARGIPAIALGAPSGFKVDGDKLEWASSGILPLEIWAFQAIQWVLQK